MNPINFFQRLVLSVAALLLLGMNSSAVVLDWASLSTPWANGATSGSFNPDASHAGNDITVAMVATGVSFTANFPQVASNDGQSTIGNNDATTLHVRTPTFNNNASTITFTITFNYTQGVNNVSFSLIDVDATTSGTGWIDGFKSISATTVANTQIGLTAVNSNPVGTTPSAQISGSGTTGMTITGQTSVGNITDHSGDVTVSSGSTAIKSLTFTWYSPNPSELGGQVIALGNISFTPVPEVGGSFGALTLCGGLFAAWRRRPARNRAAA